MSVNSRFGRHKKAHVITAATNIIAMIMPQNLFCLDSVDPVPLSSAAGTDKI